MTKRTQTALELEAKEESLSALLLQMDDYAPLIPDAVTDYYLAKGGLSTDDVRLYVRVSMQYRVCLSDDIYLENLFIYLGNGSWHWLVKSLLATLLWMPCSSPKFASKQPLKKERVRLCAFIQSRLTCSCKCVGAGADAKGKLVWL